MIRIDVLTTTRAEYGLMRPLLFKLKEDADFDFRLLVTGTHLSEEYGSTYKEILDDGFNVDYRFDILPNNNTSSYMTDMMSNAIRLFGEYFAVNRPDFLLVDGDRYESCAICLSAYSSRIPIIHVGGGDTTEGALDDAYRHCMTKLSYMHFPTNQTYANRIIQLGESPDRVLNVGSLSIENILNTKVLSRYELSQSLNFDLSTSFAVATFHPVTLEDNTAEKQILELLEACASREDIKFIFTGANADNGGAIINQIVKDYISGNDRFIYIDSLGSLRYISALTYCDFVIGNSSSGITEAPSLHIPTINIGDRQKGRIQAETTINCQPTYDGIVAAIKQAKDPLFIQKCKHATNPNGDGNTSGKIIEFIKKLTNSDSIDLKKRFFDIK